MSDRNAILEALADAVRSTPIPECQSGAAYHKWSKTIAAAVLELPEVKELMEAMERAIEAIDAAYDGPDDNGAYTVRERAALAPFTAAKETP